MMVTPSRTPLESRKSAAARCAASSCVLFGLGRLPAWLPGVVTIWPAFFSVGLLGPGPVGLAVPGPGRMVTCSHGRSLTGRRRAVPEGRAGCAFAVCSCRGAAWRPAPVSGGQLGAASAGAPAAARAGAAVLCLRGTACACSGSSSVTQRQPSGSLPGTAVTWPPGASASWQACPGARPGPPHVQEGPHLRAQAADGSVGPQARRREFAFVFPPDSTADEPGQPGDDRLPGGGVPVGLCDADADMPGTACDDHAVVLAAGVDEVGCGAQDVGRRALHGTGAGVARGYRVWS